MLAERQIQNDVQTIFPVPMSFGRANSLTGPIEIEKLALLYQTGWNQVGFNLSFDDAMGKMDKFDLSQTFAAYDERGPTYGSIHTVPVHASSLKELLQKFNHYEFVEIASNNSKTGLKDINPNYRICFSLMAIDGYKALLPDGEEISTERFLVNNLPQDEMRIVAFSRFWHVAGKTPEQLVNHYFENLSPEKSRALGAPSMHEAFGGIVAGMVFDSRKDTDGANANIIVIYPKDEKEAAEFARIKAARLAGDRRTVRLDNVLIFEDLQKNI